MLIELNITEQDLMLLDKAYESYGGTLNYLNYELKSKLDDFLKISKWEELKTDQTVKDTLEAKITAEIAEKEILLAEQIANAQAE